MFEPRNGKTVWWVCKNNQDYEKAKEFCTEQLQKKHNWSDVEKTLYIVLAYIHKKQGSEKLAKEMFEMQRKKDGKGMSAQQIYKGFISKNDKSFLNDIVETLKPFGLPDKQYVIFVYFCV